jgi:hypothetical protein
MALHYSLGANFLVLLFMFWGRCERCGTVCYFKLEKNSPLQKCSPVSAIHVLLMVAQNVRTGAIKG